MRCSKKKMNIQKHSTIVLAFTLSVSMLTVPVLGFSYDKVKIVSASTNSASTVITPPEGEVSEANAIIPQNPGTVVDRAVKAGYAQKVDKKESNDEVEFTVHNIVISRNKLYANLSLKLLKDNEFTNMHPQINVDFNEKKQTKSNNILAMLGNLASSSASRVESYSMGYSMNDEPNKDGYYEIALDGDLRDISSGRVSFKLDKIGLTKEVKTTHTVAEWLKNPEDDINIISIENTEDEFFIKAQSKNNVSFSISQNDHKDIYSNGSSSSSSGEGDMQTNVSYWKLDDRDLNLDELEITSTLFQELDGIPCDFSIDVIIDKDKIIQPIYTKDFSKTVSTISGDITLSNIQITPLSTYITYTKNNELSPVAPKEYNFPDNLESYKESEKTRTYDVYDRLDELFKIEVDGVQQWYNPVSRNDSIEKGTTEITLEVNASSDIGEISISVLQADKTYKKISLDD